MTFFLQATTSTTPTTNPMGVEITVNSNGTGNLPGTQNDMSDFYGIFIVLLVIGVVIVLSRFVFGRR